MQFTVEVDDDLLPVLDHMTGMLKRDRNGTLNAMLDTSLRVGLIALANKDGLMQLVEETAGPPRTPESRDLADALHRATYKHVPGSGQ